MGWYQSDWWKSRRNPMSMVSEVQKSFINSIKGKYDNI